MFSVSFLSSLTLSLFFSSLRTPIHTGALVACTAFLETLGGIAAVSTFTGIYSATVAWSPGFVFLLSAGLLLIPLAGLWYVLSIILSEDSWIQ